MGEVRPRVHFDTHLDKETLVRRVSRSLKSEGCEVSGLVTPERIELHVHGEEQHLWSPQLIVELSATDSGTSLEGRFGPHPSVWTMYMGAYAVCAFGVLVGMSVAYAQWVMGETPWAVASLPVALLIAGSLYALAFVGQRASEQQMKELEDFLLADLKRHESLGPHAA